MKPQDAAENYEGIIVKVDLLLHKCFALSLLNVLLQVNM